MDEKIADCGSVFDCFVDEVECLHRLVNKEIVLTQEVVQPKLNCWVLLFVILGFKDHLNFHVFAPFFKKVTYYLFFGWVSIQVDH